MKTITNIIYPAFAAFALACFAVVPRAQAVSPAPDGCYPAYTTAEGCGSLNLLTTGAGNTGLGWSSLSSDSTGNFNTGVGAGALLVNNGDSNTAVGAVALLLNTSGTQNTAVGTDAMVYNDTGHDNTANGFQALFSNTGGTEPDGSYNTAIGSQALYSNTTGTQNTANGAFALPNNTTGFFNTATGHAALESNTTGFRNTADGKGALFLNTNGGFNVATGNAALVNNTTGSKNIALGFFAGDNLTTGDNNIDIANIGVAAEANTIRFGTEVTVTDQFGIVHPAHTATYIAGIYGRTTSDPGSTIPVYVDMNGNLGTVASSERFKTEIKPMDTSSEALLALKPVTFRYKVDSKGRPQFGLIAEEVAKVNPDLVVRDRKGEIYSVRYEAVNAMLLNEFLKEHRKVEQLTKDFESKLAQQQKQIEALTAGLQKVSAQLEVSRPAAQVVENRQ